MPDRKPPIQLIAAENLKRLKNASRTLDTVEKIAKRSQIGAGTVQRVLKGQVACTIDTLEAIARSYRLEAWQLLIPALDPRNPPTLATLGRAEDDWNRRMADLLEERKKLLISGEDGQ